MGTETATEGGPPPPPPDACFDCNICLDSAAEPVVTLCGHLYCWPCIYQWIRVYPNPTSGECPVCKAAVSLDAVVPLYGRGIPCKVRPANPSPAIPRRPPARCRAGASTAVATVRRRRIPFEEDGYYPYSRADPYDEYGYPVLSSRASGGLIGGLAFAVIGGGRRTRRREMWVEDSLHQLWFFLVCCTLGCLLFF